MASGDEAAFAVLAATYSERIFFHALTFVKSYPVAEEMVQDIFMKVWITREKLRDIENFDNYLFILSKNHLISALRSKLLRSSESDDRQSESFLYRPDLIYEAKELGTLIEKGLSLLPEQRRQVFSMIRLEGMSQQEVSKKLGIAPRTVRWNLVLSTNFLQDFLRQHLPAGTVGVFYLYHLLRR